MSIFSFCLKILPKKGKEENRGRSCKGLFFEITRHIIEDRSSDKERKRRINSLKYIRFIPEILRNPDAVIANVYARKNGRLKVSKMYVKKIDDEEPILIAINYDQKEPQYRGVTLYTTWRVKGWIIR